MSRADIMAGRAYVSLYTKQDAFTRGLQSARADLNKFGSDMMAVGATFAASGAAMLAPLVASVRLASDFEESFSKFSVVFGEATTRAKEWSDSFAKEVGRSKLQIVQFMASTQDLFVPIGFEAGAAEEMSKQLTTLAVDLASFNNMQDADTLRDLHAALTGSGEVMKKYGVLVSEAAVKQELLNQGMDPSKATEMEKVQARLNIIMAGTTAAQGDALRTAGSFANQLKALKSQLTNVAVEIGTALLPSLSKIAQSMSEVVMRFVEVAKANPNIIMSFAAIAAGAVAAGAAIYGCGIAAKVMAVGISAAMTVVGVVKSVMAIAAAAISMFGTVTTAVGTAMYVFSSSIAIANGLAAASAAIAGVLATAWSTAGAVIAGVWAVITAPILPFIIAAGVVVTLIGAIAASAGLATVKAMSFTEAWTIAKDALFSIIDVVRQVGGILMTAFQQGDYDIAFKAAMAGIKLVLATSLDAMKNLWVMFWEGAWKAAKMFFENVARKTIAIVSATAQIFSNPVAAGMKMQGILNDIAKNTNLSFGIDTKGMADSAKAELAKLEKELAARQAQRDAKAKQDAAADAASNPPAGDPAAPGGNVPGGSPADAAAAAESEAKAEQAASAFERETEALEAQIIALREGEEAAERFRLAKQGLSEEQINSVMGMKAEQKALEAQKQAEQDAIEKKQEASQRLVQQVQDIADADYEKNNKLTDAEEKKKKDGTLTAAEMAAIEQRKLTPAQIAMKEKAAIERGRQRGAIDDKTAAEATAQADIRQAEKEHQERLKKFRGEGDALTGNSKDIASVGLKMGGASAATFSAQSLLSMGSGSGQGPQLRAMIDTKKAIEMQTKQAQDNADAVVAAVKQSKMKHT